VSERLRHLADTIVGYSAGVKSGELVLLEGSVAVEPLIDELYRSVLKAGAHPVTRVELELTEFLATPAGRFEAWYAEHRRAA